MSIADEVVAAADEVLAAAAEEAAAAKRRVIDSGREQLDTTGCELLEEAYAVLKKIVGDGLSPFLRLVDVHWFGFDCYDRAVPIPDDPDQWTETTFNKMLALDAALVGKDGTGIARVYYKRSAPNYPEISVTADEGVVIDNLPEHIREIYAPRARRRFTLKRRRREEPVEMTIASIAVGDVRAQLNDLQARVKTSDLSAPCKKAAVALIALGRSILAKRVEDGYTGSDSFTYELTALSGLLGASLQLHRPGAEFDEQFQEQVASLRRKLERDPEAEGLDGLSASRGHSDFLRSRE